MCLGLLSHRRGRMSKSSACCQHSSLSDIMMSRSELVVPGDQLQYYAQEPCLLLLVRAATKVVRPRSGRRSRCTDKDRSKETEDRALIFCYQAHSSLSMKTILYSLAKPDPYLSFKSLALQDYNNRASDDEPATVPC